MRAYYIENFGCRAAQADGSAIERQLATRGMRRVNAVSDADVVVLNTCTVTSAADSDARAAIRRTHRARPAAQILVTGCYAQRAPQEISGLEGVTWVVGNSHKSQIGDIVSRSFGAEAAAPAAISVAISSTFSAKTEALTPFSDPVSHAFDGNAEAFGSKTDAFAANAVAFPPPAVAAPSTAAAFVPLAALNALVNDAASASPGYAESYFPAQKVYASDIFAHTELHAAPVFEGIARTRANLKVQDGCDNRCSFCVIPYVRGGSRSLKADEILREIDALVAAGYQEIVISGINLGRWGRDFDVPQRFCGLIQRILSATAVAKLRLSSVEPMDWTDDLIYMLKDSLRIAKHAHIPLQSGSDTILRRMHRKYRPWHYAEKVEKIRSLMPDAAIGADVMVGFPGETEELFEESRSFIAQLPFTYLHVFTYSPRPGTPAASMPNQVPIHEARRRNRVLRELAAEKNLQFRNSFLGRTVEAITLNQSQNGMTEALTDNYVKLQIEGEHESNRWMDVRVEAVSETGLVARTHLCSGGIA